MKKIFVSAGIIALSSLILSSCRHDTLEDRAEKETREFTQRYCPTPADSTTLQRTDSLTFTRNDKTIHYYFTLVGKADNEEIIQKMMPELKKAIRENLKNDTKNRAYKEAGFKFHYVYRSESTGKVLLEETLSGK
ncbi:MAG: hypothetical protein ACOYJF_03230 [Prevotella sp.]|jgi:hypothetical protein